MEIKHVFSYREGKGGEHECDRVYVKRLYDTIVGGDLLFKVDPSGGDASRTS